jgi:hypothetical protein
MTEQHQKLTVTTPLKVGQSCGATPEACASGLCIAMSNAVPPDTFCSKQCGGDGDCPVGWHCRNIFPSDQGFICIAAAGWQGGVASFGGP